MLVKRRFDLTYARLGAAALAVQRQDLLRRPIELSQVGDQEEGMQQQIIGAFLLHQLHATRGGPGARLVGQVIAPLPKLLGRAAPWSGQV